MYIECSFIGTWNKQRVLIVILIAQEKLEATNQIEEGVEHMVVEEVDQMTEIKEQVPNKLQRPEEEGNQGLEVDSKMQITIHHIILQTQQGDQA